jgi:hypothetical protein
MFHMWKYRSIWHSMFPLEARVHIPLFIITFPFPTSLLLFLEHAYFVFISITFHHLCHLFFVMCSVPWHAIAQAIRRWLLTLECSVQSWVTWFVVGNNGTRANFLQFSLAPYPPPPPEACSNPDQAVHGWLWSKEFSLYAVRTMVNQVSGNTDIHYSKCKSYQGFLFFSLKHLFAITPKLSILASRSKHTIHRHVCDSWQVCQQASTVC